MNTDNRATYIRGTCRWCGEYTDVSNNDGRLCVLAGCLESRQAFHNWWHQHHGDKPFGKVD